MAFVLALAGHAQAVVSAGSKSAPAEPRDGFETLRAEFVLQLQGSETEELEIAAKATLCLQRDPLRWSRHSRFTGGGERLQLFDGTWRYDIDLTARKGTRQWASRELAAGYDEAWDDEMHEMGELRPEGTADVAGRTCAVWISDDGFMHDTYWVWGGVQLASESRIDGELTDKTRAERLEVDPALPEDTWLVPEGVELTEQRFPGQIYLEILARDMPANAVLATRSVSTDEIGSTEAGFPDVGPFVAQPEWRIVHGAGALDIDRSVTRMGIFLGSLVETKAALVELGLTPGGEGPTKLSIGRSDERIWWMTIPRLVDALGGLREVEAWDDAMLQAAREAARFLALHPEGLLVDFEVADGRRARVDAVGRWFLEQVAKPERYATMLGTLDDGPFVGEAVEDSRELERIDDLALRGPLRLELCARSGADPVTLRCLDGERVLWTRRVTGGSVGAVQRLEIPDRPADDYGSLGWRVLLRADWSYGSEALQLFLARDGSFLFYYLSW